MLGLLKKEELEEEEERRIKISRRTRWWYLKCVIVYLARDIPAFVMYCVNGESGLSLLIESTDSMIHKAGVAWE